MDSQILRHLKESNLPQDLVNNTMDYLHIRNQIVHETTISANKY